VENWIQISRLEAENIPGRLPDSVTCYSKSGNTENEAKVRFTYTQGEILGLVGMWMWAMKHTQAAAV